MCVQARGSDRLEESAASYVCAGRGVTDWRKLLSPSVYSAFHVPSAIKYAKSSRLTLTAPVLVHAGTGSKVQEAAAAVPLSHMLVSAKVCAQCACVCRHWD